MSKKFDDVRYKVKPLEAPKDATFKQGKKTACNNLSKKSKKSVFHGTKMGSNPLFALMEDERNGTRTKNNSRNKHRV